MSHKWNSKNFQISFKIHEDVWYHFPVHLENLEKGTTNATIYTKSDSNSKRR